MKRITVALLAAALVFSLTACGESKPLICPEGQHVEDQGYYAVLPQYIPGANGTTTMIMVPVWMPNEVCVQGAEQ